MEGVGGYHIVSVFTISRKKNYRRLGSNFLNFKLYLMEKLSITV